MVQRVLSIFVIIVSATSVVAQEGLRAPIITPLDSIRVQRVTLRPSLLKAGLPGGAEVVHVGSLVRGDCPSVMSTHTDSDWGPGEYVLQAGFAQGESAAASYELSADSFPLKLDSVELMFATSNAVVETTTEWTVRIYSGTPDTGTLVSQWSSDGDLLPHLVMPPGTTGMIVLFTVDPNDPDQIYIEDDGSHVYTVGYRIDSHNQPGSPCLSAPDPNYNAFPCTDTSGLDEPTQNWINMVAGPFCICGEGWGSFQSLPNICRPSGDWVLRSAVTPQDCVAVTGACCLEDGSCEDELQSSSCDDLDGTYQGDDSMCANVDCPSPSGACCIESTGDCVDLESDLCELGGGIHHPGASCATLICFPEGACCLPDGTCVSDVAPEMCEIAGGLFQGDGSTCVSDLCPQPLGACCLTNGNCIDVEDTVCVAFGGSWKGAASSCNDPGICDSNPCPSDVNGDGVVDVNDLLNVIADWNTPGSGGTDINGDGVVDVNDLLAIISSWGVC
jgi:hypothetical protein